jgi:anti-sigma28 factor (negative regulator of flagellin synthesis)
MTKVLKLGGAKLLVYALIYSFTVNDGLFFGSRGYIAEACGITDTTVGRVLKELLQEGLLIKNEERTNFETQIYTAIIPFTDGKDTQNEPSAKSVSPIQNVYLPPANCTPSPSKMTDNNKDYTKTNKHTSTQTAPARAHEEGDTEGTNRFAKEGNTNNVRVILEGENKAEEVEELKREIEEGRFRGDIKVPGDMFLEDELIQRKHGIIDPKRNCDDDLRCTFTKFGYRGMVMLTEAQYDYLTRTYGEDIIGEYIQRLESTILNKFDFKSYSHYKTILKWLKEDMSCADAFAPA